jgi:hypothetical protein
MARTKISEFSATPASNTDIDSIFIGEGMAPSNVNDAIRELMAQLKDFQVGSAGDPVTVGGVLTVQAGSASTPALTTAGDTNTGMFFPAADTIAFAEGGAEAMRLDASGNLGLGVTPSAWNSGYKVLQLNTQPAVWGLSDALFLSVNQFQNTSGSNRYIANGFATQYRQDAGTHQFYTAPSGTAGNAITFTQALTLDASGNLLVGQTTANSGNPVNSNSAALTLGGNGATWTINHSATSAGSLYAQFGYSGTKIGSITVATSSTVAYNTSSDYRLKNITGQITNSGAYIDSLNPVEGTWKTDGSIFVGLIAHEVQEASRTIVATGTKDGEEMQGMDYSSSEIIANLIAEVKSLRQRVATLEAQ